MPIARYAMWNRSASMQVLFGVACLWILAGFGSLAKGHVPTAVAPILLGTLFTAYMVFSPAISVRRQIKASAHVTEMGTYQFDETGFKIARPSLEVSMAWAKLHSVVELPALFAIFTTKTSFYAVPKRFFEADRLGAFRGLLQQVSRQSGRPFIVRR